MSYSSTFRKNAVKRNKGKIGHECNCFFFFRSTVRLKSIKTFLTKKEWFDARIGFETVLQLCFENNRKNLSNSSENNKSHNDRVIRNFSNQRKDCSFLPLTKIDLPHCVVLGKLVEKKIQSIITQKKVQFSNS